MEKASHSATGAASKIVSFTRWLPYAVAACLMIIAIFEARHIRDLRGQLLAAREDEHQLWMSNNLKDLRLTPLDVKEAAQDPSYASSKIIVAWDPHGHRGVVATQNLPPPPAGHDYQFWVLDPAAESPISAGLMSGSRSFAVKPVSTPNPGFAISLEPGGGSPVLTGPILFAVAPGL